MITLVYRCGHKQEVSDDFETPICPICGERQVGRVTAPPPRFRGVATGPHCTEALTVGTVNLAPGGPLLKR